MPFSDIKRIRRKVTREGKKDEGSERGKKAKSMPCKAFEMFLAGRTPVQVAIDLDLEPNRVTSILYDFLRLQKMHKTTTILKENKDHLAPFVKLLEEIKINITRVRDIRNAMDSIISIKARTAKEQTEGEDPINKRGEGLSVGQPGRQQNGMLLKIHAYLAHSFLISLGLSPHGRLGRGTSIV